MSKINTRIFKNTEVFFKLFIYLFIYFFMHYFYDPSPRTRSKCKKSEFYHHAPMFPLVHLCVSHQFLLSLEEPSTLMEISPWTTLTIVLGMCPTNFILLYCFFSSELKWHVHCAVFLARSAIQVLHIWYTYNCKNDDL